jgi:sarcosine oxidase subunit beta
MMDSTAADSGEVKGASVIIVGGGATGFSAGWWLARAGVDVLVIEKGIVAWEASGRNGGGCAHHFSPLFAEEQRLWPQMDELLGYPTEFQPGRIYLAMERAHEALADRMMGNGARYGFRTERLDHAQLRELVPLAGDVHAAYWLRFGGHANPHRTVQGYAWAMQDHGGRMMQHTTVQGFAVRGAALRASRRTAACSGATNSCWRPGRRRASWRRCSGCACPSCPRGPR